VELAQAREQIWPGKNKTLLALSGLVSEKKGNKTQAIVLYLFKQLPKARYHVTLNNLFTSYALIKAL
jgi:hypothetical protein